MKKILKIIPYYRWAFENCDDYCMTCGYFELFEKYIEWVFVQRDDMKTWFDYKDVITLYGLSYFSRIDIERDWHNSDFKIIDYEVREKFQNRDKNWDDVAHNIIERDFEFLEISAVWYSQSDFQSWVFVFRIPTSKKDWKELQQLEKCLEDNLSKVFTGSEFYFSASIVTEKEDEVCEKEIDDFNDLWIYNDDTRLPEDNEELQKKIKEVKEKYNIDEVIIEDVVY